MPLSKYISIIIISLFFFSSGCRDRKVKKEKKRHQPPKELVVYCENTMLNVVVDLKQAFEKLHNCRVVIQNDCSKNLMGIIHYSAVGDLYIPSSTHTFKDFYANTGQVLTDSLFIGYNHLVYMVKKGNPKGFKGYLAHLKSKNKYAVIIANSETSSLGYETKRFLKQQRSYDHILMNAVSLTSDSKGLVKGLKEDQADVVINWQSNIYVNGNSNHVEVIRPQSPHNNTFPVYAAVLSCCSEPKLARAFLDLASAQLSESKLSGYGFSKRQTIIF